MSAAHDTRRDAEAVEMESEAIDDEDAVQEPDEGEDSDSNRNNNVFYKPSELIVSGIAL